MSSPLLDKFGRVYNAGDLLFCEFEEGSECFVVHEGQVSIVKISEGAEKVLAILGPGDIFGEMGVLEKKPRTATAIALTDVTVLALDINGLQAIIKAQPEFAWKLGRTLSQRIVQAYRHLANLAIDSPRLRIVDMLLWKMEEPAEGNPVTPLSPQELADYAGLPVAEVDKVMHEFTELGRIRPRADSIEILDIRSLRRLINPSSR